MGKQELADMLKAIFTATGRRSHPTEPQGLVVNVIHIERLTINPGPSDLSPSSSRPCS